MCCETNPCLGGRSECLVSYLPVSRRAKRSDEHLSNATKCNLNTGWKNSSKKLPAVFSHGPLRKSCRKSLSHQISERNQKLLRQHKEHWQMKTKRCDARRKWKHGEDVRAMSVLSYRTNSPADRRKARGFKCKSISIFCSSPLFLSGTWKTEFFKTSVFCFSNLYFL